MRQKIVISSVLSFLIAISSFAQKPEINALDKVKGSTGESLLIQGSSFGTDATKLVVNFGAMRGQIKSITNTQLEVAIPNGATFGNLGITNLTNGLSGYSDEPFLLSFGGTLPFDPSKLSSQFDFNAELGLYDVCLCDLDNDNKIDAVAANQNNSNFTILQNTSTGPGSVTFTKIPFGIASPTLHVKCGDLNGDGKKDLIIIDATAGSNRIFVVRNNSTPGVFNFTATPITLAGSTYLKAEIADLDLDGKPEVILTSSTNNIIKILTNTSTLANIQFAATPLTITVAGTATTDAIVAADLNGDHYPELATSQFNTNPNSNLFIFENKSLPGTIAFSAPSVITINSIKSIQFADLDSDGKTDIATTGVFTNNIAIFRNTTSGTAISFASPIFLVSETAPWGMDIGDLDGDGKADLAVASANKTKINIFANTSTPGSLSFSTHAITTTNTSRQIKLGDVDGDGKPDIVFTQAAVAPKVSVMRNKHCVFPKISPETAIVNICTSRLPYTLTTTLSPGSFYEWRNGATLIKCGINENTLEINDAGASGTYTVRLRQEGSNCSTDAGDCELESSVQINISAGSATNPNPTSNGPICLGSTMQLSLTDVGATAYKWTGPENYTGTGVNPVAVSNFQLRNAGYYQVDVISGTCIARTEKILVEAIDVPSFQIGFTGSNVICFGEPAKTLNILPNSGSFTYQWFQNGNLVGTGPTYSVTSVLASSGTYTAKASLSGCSTVETPPRELSVANGTDPDFTVTPNPACANQQITFNNNSTYDANIPPVFKWTFGDGNTSTEESPKHTYLTDGTFNFTLQVSYADGACANVEGASITVTPAPPISIVTPGNITEFCEGKSLTLTASGSFTDYLWSTGATTQSIEADLGTQYSVTVTSGSCDLTAYKTLTMKPGPTLITSVNPSEINEGESAALSVSGASSYLWSPSELVDNSTSENPIAGPLTQTTTFTVTGTDVNGCSSEVLVIVNVKGEAIVNKLKPSNFFSPDNQGAPESEFWQVEGILDFPQCKVTIYDDKGVKVYDSKPYSNDWNGTFKGKPVPDGVYFYVIRCDGEESKPKTGSITILRK